MRNIPPSFFYSSLLLFIFWLPPPFGASPHPASFTQIRALAERERDRVAESRLVERAVEWVQEQVAAVFFNIKINKIIEDKDI